MKRMDRDPMRSYIRVVFQGGGGVGEWEGLVLELLGSHYRGPIQAVCVCWKQRNVWEISRGKVIVFCGLCRYKWLIRLSLRVYRCCYFELKYRTN